LDQTDRRILTILSRDARISFAALGREIGLSRTAVQDRVSKLEAAGVIKGYHTNYSEDQAGTIRAMLFIKIASRPCDEALDWLASLSEVVSVVSIAGEIDAVAYCNVASPSDLTLLNDKIGANELIASSTASLILTTRS